MASERHRLHIAIHHELVAGVWITNFAPPIVVNGQNGVTNPIYGTQQFFPVNASMSA